MWLRKQEFNSRSQLQFHMTWRVIVAKQGLRFDIHMSFTK